MLLHGEHGAAHDARGLHPARDADDEDDQQEDAGFRPERRAQRVAEQHDDDEQQRQEWQGEEQVGQSHQPAVEAPHVAGGHADRGADKQRQQHRGDTDGERGSSAGQHLGKHVAPQIVGAHRMGEGNPLVLVADVQRRRIDAVNVRAEDDQQDDRQEDACADDAAAMLAELPEDVGGDGALLARRGGRRDRRVSHSGSSDREFRRAGRRSG